MPNRDRSPFLPKEFDGGYYAAVGDALGEKYLDFGFARGTAGEVDFLVEELGLARSAKVLDVGCGVGRHSLELARRGFRLVGLDISRRFVDVADAAARAESLAAEFVLGDARDMRFESEFDAAICLCEGAFGLAGSDANHLRVLRGVARALRPGAPFVLTAMNAYAAVRAAPPDYDVYGCTWREHLALPDADGVTRDHTLYTSAFTFRELELMFQMAGMSVEAGYGCEAGRFGREPLTVDATEVMVLGRRKVG
jgi:SAM-dependent methyltransferase